jgi:hypothetical protein
MNILKSRTSKSVVFALAAILQLYVSGGFAFAAPDTSGVAVKPAARHNIQGRLTTTGDDPVSVNGNSAKTGETIFSGQVLQTPDQTGASVYIAGLGSVEVAPKTSLTLSFSDSRISARLAAGCAVLAPAEGVEGVVETKATTEKTTSKAISLCVDANGAVVQNQQQDDDDDKKKKGGAVIPGSPQAPPPVATGGGLSNAAAVVLTAGAVTAFSIIAHELISDSENPGASNCTPIPGTTSPLTPPSGCVP